MPLYQAREAYMPASVPYEDRKERIRDELRRYAAEGATVTYAELGLAVGVPTQGPWRPVLDVISREEEAAGLPDVTYLVVSRTTGYSGRIQFKDARRPTPEQVAASEEVQRRVWAMYGVG